MLVFAGFVDLSLNVIALAVDRTHRDADVGIHDVLLEPFLNRSAEFQGCKAGGRDIAEEWHGARGPCN